MNTGMHRMAAWAMVMLATLAPVAAVGSVCTWTGSWDTTPSAAEDEIVIAGGGNLAWSNTLPATVASWIQQASYSATVTVYTVFGASGFTEFTVTGDAAIMGGTLTHRGNTTGEVNRLALTVNGNLVVGTNAAIGSLGLGYSAGNGPGGAASGNGATHGGRGGNGPVTVYGSTTAPMNLGSGGNNAGGGAIRLIVKGTLTHHGVITASTPWGSYSGAGGSVCITAGAIAGSTSGVIRASGTPNGSSYYGGGGGRVAVVVTNAGADFSGHAGAMQAYGGWVGGRSGAAGTVYTETPAQGAGQGTLVIDNAGGYDLSSTQIYTLVPSGTDLSDFDQVVIRNNGHLAVGTGSLLDFGSASIMGQSATAAHVTIVDSNAAAFPDPFVISRYTLNPNGVRHVTGDWVVSSNGRLSHAAGLALDLTIDGNLTVLAGGAINVDSRGSTGGMGAGTTSGHGGLGGDPASMGATYGLIIAPTNLGSGTGGGAIIVRVAGTLTNNGTITAMGGAKASGGSVNITAGSLVGAATGIIRAPGGGGDNGYSGGGGRVAVAVTNAGADFSGYAGTLSAYGGHSYQPRRGAAGTVYRAMAATPPAGGTVLVDNENYVNDYSTNTVTSLPGFAASAEDLTRTTWTVQRRGKIGLVTNTAIWSLSISNNASIDLAGFTLTTRLLTITNAVYREGVFSAADLGPLVSDRSGGAGQIVVRAVNAGTVIMLL